MHKRKTFLIGLSLFSIIALIAWTITGMQLQVRADIDTGTHSTQVVEQSNTDQEKHCVVTLEAVKQGEQFSKMSQPKCFNNLSDAIFEGTGGKVRLSATIKPNELTRDMLKGQYASSPTGVTGNTVISIDYDGAYSTGETIVWSVTDGGCSSNPLSYRWYQAGSMPSGWDNRVSSSQVYDGCVTNNHYDYTNYGGAVIACPCPNTMGAMDNATSSEKWGPE